MTPASAASRFHARAPACRAASRVAGPRRWRTPGRDGGRPGRPAAKPILARSCAERAWSPAVAWRALLARAGSPSAARRRARWRARAIRSSSGPPRARARRTPDRAHGWPARAGNRDIGRRSAGCPRLERVFRVIAAAVKEKRRRARAPRAAFDFPDEDHVIAFLVAAAVEAFERGGRTFEQRRAARTQSKEDPAPAVRALERETLGELLLVLCEHIDRVVRSRAEHGERARGLREAPEHERRGERDGVERIGGEADL